MCANYHLHHRKFKVHSSLRKTGQTLRNLFRAGWRHQVKFPYLLCGFYLMLINGKFIEVYLSACEACSVIIFQNITNNNNNSFAILFVNTVDGSKSSDSSNPSTPPAASTKPRSYADVVGHSHVEAFSNQNPAGTGKQV